MGKEDIDVKPVKKKEKKLWEICGSSRERIAGEFISFTGNDWVKTIEEK